jgi:hypothetical protein
MSDKHENLLFSETGDNEINFFVEWNNNNVLLLQWDGEKMKMKTHVRFGDEIRLREILLLAREFREFGDN